MTTGNLSIQAFSAVVTPEQGYKVTVNFGAGFDLTNAAVRVYQRSKQLTAGVPNLAVTGQQIVITYSVEQLTELRKAASVTQHHIYLPNMLYTTRVGWEITVVNKFSDGVQVESLLDITLGEDGETIAVSISGADVVAGLVAQAEAARDSVVEDAAQTALDRVATGEDRTQTGADRALAVTARNEAVAAKDLAVPAAATATTKAGEAAADRVQTGLDRIATGLDKTSTAADRVQTGLDAASALASKNSIPISSQVYATDAAGRATVTNGQTYLIKATGDNIVELRRRTDASNSTSEGFYPSSSAVASNTSLIYQKFNEVFTPATITGWNYKAKGRGTGGSKRVQAVIVFNVSAISYGGSPVNIKFDAKFLSKSSNCLSVSERFIQGRDSATPATGTAVSMFGAGGAATLVKDVVYTYSVTESWSGVKSNYLHVFVNFDPIDEDAINDLIIYDAQLTVGGVSGIVGLSALYLPNVGDTTTGITSLSSPAATVAFANEKETNAKVYVDSLLGYFQDNENFDLHLATTGASWYSAATNNFLVAEDNVYLLGLGVKKQIKLNSGQFISTTRRDLLFRVVYPSVIDGKYIQTVYFIKTTDPGKFNLNTCYVAKGISVGQFVVRTPSSTTAIEKSPGVWEVRNTFQAPSSGSYNEVWVGSSFTDGGSDNTSALSVSGFMSYIQSEPITYAKLSIELPDLRKRIQVNSDAIALIQANPLVGKKLGALGDSITEGHGTVLTKTYHELTATRNGMTSFNYGLSGTRLCDDRVTFGLGMSNPDRYTAMNADLDYITVWGGTNDILSVGVNSDMTRSTFKGALNLLCIGLIERYPTKKIGFLTPLNHKTPTDTMLTYADAILEICHRYAIPVLDLYRESGIYPLNTIQRTALMYTSSDYQHPNNLGHEILAAKYEAFLRRL